MRVFRVLGKEFPFMSNGAPEQLAVLTTEAENQLLLAFFVRSGKEDAITDHDRTGVAASGHLRLPKNVLRRSPFRDYLAIPALAVAKRAAPPRPIILGKLEWRIRAFVSYSFLVPASHKKRRDSQQQSADQQAGRGSGGIHEDIPRIQTNQS